MLAGDHLLLEVTGRLVRNLLPPEISISERAIFIYRQADRLLVRLVPPN